MSAGVTVMFTDFGPQQDRTFYPDSSTAGFHLALGAALLWPHDWFEVGPGFRYLVQGDDAIPNGFIGELLFGVRL